MKKTAITFLGFAAAHFAISYGGAFLLLLTINLSRPDIVGVFESVLVAGVAFCGLPDTTVGWFLNSLLYGFIFAVVFFFGSVESGESHVRAHQRPNNALSQGFRVFTSRKPMAKEKMIGREWQWHGWHGIAIELSLYPSSDDNPTADPLA